MKVYRPGIHDGFPRRQVMTSKVSVGACELTRLKQMILKPERTTIADQKQYSNNKTPLYSTPH